MYLLGHNARLIEIDSPAVPADPVKGTPSTPRTVRWQGSCDAYVDEDLVDEIRAGQRVTFSRTIIDLPVNIPVWPNQEDIITLRRTGVIAPVSPSFEESPPTDTMVVRSIDGGLIMLGKLRLVTVRS